jgi:hypothetical protein
VESNDPERHQQWVHFRVRDAYIPNPQDILMKLYGDYIVQGRVIDTSESNAGPFAVVEIEGLDEPVIVSFDHILGILWMDARCARASTPRIHLYRVPKGRSGSLVTAGMIADLILAGAKDFRVRQHAIQVFRTAGVRPKDRLGEVQALFRWVQRHIRYTRDILRVETLHTARRMLQLRAGDCDDMTILLGSMLLSTGHPVRLALAGFGPHRPHSYSHIYPEVLVNGCWIPADATMPYPLGWAPPALWKRLCDVCKEGLRCL